MPSDDPAEPASSSHGGAGHPRMAGGCAAGGGMAIAALQAAEVARLERLRQAILPLLAEVPPDMELFDAALLPALRPRLFIDMVTFVEMARDRRRYRLVQDTRRGRLVLVESERPEVVRDAVAAHVARRLAARDRAFGEGAIADTAPRSRFAWLPTALAVVLHHLGIAALVVLLWVLGHALYGAWHGR